MQTTGGTKAFRIAVLRQVVMRLERGLPDPAEERLSLGAPSVDRHLPGAGLACGALHEVVAATHGDRPAAFGFLAALMVRVLAVRRGPAMLVAAPRCFDFGRPYGHGLCQFGLDASRLVLVETRQDKDALWTMDEALRSKAPAVVAGLLERDLDLTMSRRLSLAAASSATPLLLLRPSPAAGASAAATRWRVAAASPARDGHGAFAGCRWSVALERCRNGRIGQWPLAWDHVAHRIRLAEVLADCTPVESANPRGRRLAG
ncbi:MAG TPA: ImuA protein [Hyphomicrobiaceae bacterium]|nr:ImuA protein [Hyphomicrobiaceae bacterium]